MLRGEADVAISPRLKPVLNYVEAGIAGPAGIGDDLLAAINYQTVGKVIGRERYCNPIA